MKMTRLCAALAIAMASPGLHAEDKPLAAPPEQAQLLGQWKFNADKSDNVREKMRAHHEASGHEGRGPGGGRSGRGGPGGPGGPGGGGGRMGGGRMGGGPHGGMGDGQQQWEARRTLMEELADPAQVMTIVIADSELTLTSDDGRVRRLRPDGKDVKGEGGLERKAHWEAGHLIVESKVGSTKMTETWSFATEEPKLHVTMRLEGEHGEPLVIQTAYDSVPLH